VSASFDSARREQQQAAVQRFAAQAARRQTNIEALRRSGGLAEVNTAEELARRLDRVTRYYAGEELPTSAGQLPGPSAPEKVIELALDRAATSATAAAPAESREAAEAVAAVIPGREPATEAEQAESKERAGIVLEKIINTADLGRWCLSGAS
jgi:hypothetical protein